MFSTLLLPAVVLLGVVVAFVALWRTTQQNRSVTQILAEMEAKPKK
jgi:hypothetical protein